MDRRYILSAMLAIGTLVAPLSVAAQTSASTAAPATTAPAEQAAGVARQVLFVGNSYFYYNDSLHNHVRRMAAEMGVAPLADLEFRSITISGGSLSMHPMEYYLKPGTIGYDKPFDLVILQDHSESAMSDKRRASFRDTVTQDVKLINATGARAMIYMTPAYEEGHEKYDPAMLDKNRELAVAVGKETGATVIPVGLAFAEAHRQRPDLPLWQSYDHSHPTLAGTYLAAAVTAATIYGKSPVGLKYDYYGKLPAETASFLQKVAEEVVTAFKAQ